MAVATREIELGAFLKWAGVAGTGGQAKELVAAGTVRVNGNIETHRGRKLRRGDRIAVPGEVLVVGGDED